MMRVYYAHCIAIYSTPQEDRDVSTLEETFGIGCVVNPNSPRTNDMCEDIRAAVEKYNKVVDGHGDAWPKRDASQEIMDNIFKPLAQSCDVLAFRALPDGRIPAGVAQEIKWAAEIGAKIIELPSRLTSRSISVEETREYLREVGSR